MTVQALDDSQNIAQYISRQSYKFASLQVHRFFERVAIITVHHSAMKLRKRRVK